jgi:hypothetical protein
VRAKLRQGCRGRFGSGESAQDVIIIISDEPIVARVRIEYGTTALGPNDNPKRRRDVSVMDDFVYGEPQAIDPSVAGKN